MELLATGGRSLSIREATADPNRPSGGTQASCLAACDCRPPNRRIAGVFCADPHTPAERDRSASGRSERRPSMSTLPAGPRWPRAVQTLAWWTRPLPFFERCRARYGPRFTVRLLATAAVRPPQRSGRDQAGVHRAARGPAPRRGRADPRAGRRPELGDPARRGPAPEQRKLMLPAFHGERMAAPDRPRDRGRRARGRALAARRAGRAAPRAAGADARDHPARGLRPRSRPAPRRAARAGSTQVSSSRRRRSA